MYVYEGEIYCDACGRADEVYHSEEATDSPVHCAAGSNCVNWIQIGDVYVGDLVGDSLTDVGVEYVKDVIRAGGLCAGLWRTHFNLR